MNFCGFVLVLGSIKSSSPSPSITSYLEKSHRPFLGNWLVPLISRIWNESAHACVSILYLSHRRLWKIGQQKNSKFIHPQNRHILWFINTGAMIVPYMLSFNDLNRHDDFRLSIQSRESNINTKMAEKQKEREGDAKIRRITALSSWVFRFVNLISFLATKFYTIHFRLSCSAE